MDEQDIWDEKESRKRAGLDSRLRGNDEGWFSGVRGKLVVMKYY